MNAKTAGCLAALSGFVVVSFVGCDRFFDSLCGNTVLKSLSSPDGKLKAVVFERDCGATTGFSTQLSVLGAGDPLPNDEGNIFIADTDHGAAPAGPGGGPAINVLWEGPRKLLIELHSGARRFKTLKQLSVRTASSQSETVTVRYLLSEQ
jgi:hypothetical protein